VCKDEQCGETFCSKCKASYIGNNGIHMLGNMEHRLDYVYHAENANSIRQYSTSGTEPGDVDNRYVADEGVTHIEDESEPVCEETQKAIEQNADLIDYDADEDESIYLEPEFSQDKNVNDGPNLSAGAPVRNREASGLYSGLLFAPLFHPIFVPSVCSLPASLI
jgi:hypothetical protein